MVIFNSYVKLPEGRHHFDEQSWGQLPSWPRPHRNSATPQDEGWAQQIARHPIFDNVTILATQQRTVNVVHQP